MAPYRTRILSLLLVILGAFFALPHSLSATDSGIRTSPGVVSAPVITSPTAGAQHTCVVRDSTAWCTGANSQGQLGNGSLVRTAAFSPSLFTDAISVAAGGNTTCGIKTDLTLWCWGSIPTTIDSSVGAPVIVRSPTSTPVQIPLANVMSVAVGARHTCALLKDATVWCWGDNTRGQLGNGMLTPSTTPVRAAITKVQSLDVGISHTCAVRTTQSVWCWGSNLYFRLGVRSITSATTPTYVPKMRAKKVVTGDAFTCIVTTGQRVRCWGRNQYGQLSANAGKSRYQPSLSILRNVQNLSAGSEFACATLLDTSSWCWGRNRYSQLANGLTFARATPQRITSALSVGNVTSIATGDTHACAVTQRVSAMWCWGLGLQGQLGDGGSGTRSRGTAIWPNGVTMNPIGTDMSARLVVTGDVSCDDARRTANGNGPLGSQCGDIETAASTTVNNPDGILLLGDIQYEGASAAELKKHFNVSWGPLKSKVYPIRGNHEYITSGAAGYVDYFQEMSPSYWVTNAGGWRIIAVDSWCLGLVSTGCTATAPQTQWLASQLQQARQDGKCSAVLLHHPYISSGKFATPSVKALWETAANGGADLMLTAHDHHYERFQKVDANAEPSPAGMRLFIAGLGGAPAYPLSTTHPASEYRSNSIHGVMTLTLTPSAYAWGFVQASDNSITDSGADTCTP